MENPIIVLMTDKVILKTTENPVDISGLPVAAIGIIYSKNLPIANRKTPGIGSAAIIKTKHAAISSTTRSVEFCILFNPYFIRNRTHVESNMSLYPLSPFLAITPIQQHKTKCC